MAAEAMALATLPFETARPAVVRNRVYHHLGQVILALNKVRHEIQGYRTPRPFPVTEIDTVIAYDFNVVRKWLEAYRVYAGADVSLEGRRLLELGPGADLGVGLISLARGAAAYHAIDVNDLVTQAPDALYDALLERLQRDGTEMDTVAMLRDELARSRDAVSERLDYVCRKDFDIRTFAGQGVDLVVSHAAFEHFDDVNAVIAQTSEVVAPGAVLVAEVDLQTHTRKIRDADPLNIYRYSDGLYRFLKFLGSPNRVRPYEYEAILEKHGWRNIRTYPVLVVSDEHVSEVRGALNGRFRDARNEMHVLNMVICATKG